MVCMQCGQELASPQARFCGKCGASQTKTQPVPNNSPRSPSTNTGNRRLWVVTAAFGVAGIIALFIYVTRPGPCDGIFEQTAPKLNTTIHFLKANGETVIGSDKVQELAESSQRIGILCKTCCIAQQSGKIGAGQFQDCLNTTKSYETQLLQVASNVDAANSAKQNGQVELVNNKKQQATLAASAAASQVQKLDDSVTALSNNSAAASDASSSLDASPPSASNNSLAGPPPPKSVVITETNGTTIGVYEDSLRLFSYGLGNVPLESGQSLDFSKMKAIEILGVDNRKATVRITLVGGKTIEGTVGQWFVSGRNDLGDVNIPQEQVKRVDFPH